VFVHRDNPIERLTLDQLRRIFGHDHRDAKANIRSWRQLGLTGRDWDRAITLYGPSADSGTGRYFRRAVLGGSTKMNWDALTEFSDPPLPGHVDQSGKEILAALATDRYGIALAPLQFARDEVKPVALAAAAGAPAFAAARATLVDRRYPLARSVWAYVT